MKSSGSMVGGARRPASCAIALSEMREGQRSPVIGPDELRVQSDRAFASLYADPCPDRPLRRASQREIGGRDVNWRNIVLRPQLGRPKEVRESKLPNGLA